MDPILDDLNDEQRQAVLHDTGPLMVLAGAGSGKTRVVTRRIARLLRDGENPWAILAVTFTNKAAGEMARRVEELGGRRVHVATFHSACARFLRRHAERLGFPPSYSIYDTYDRDSSIKTLLEDRDLKVDKVSASDVGRRISRLKNEGLNAEEFRRLGLRSELDGLVAEVWGPYQERLLRSGAMDFDDLLLHFLQLLRDLDVTEEFRERFRWILVDEFQDTNRVQYDIVRHLSGADVEGASRNLCVVGDPDQSIYRFRGAEIGNLLGFQRDFPDVEVVRLETNYRSTATILRAAQALIEHNEQRLDKVLRPARDEGQKIDLHIGFNAVDEARYVARRIGSLISRGVALSEIAIFYRAHHLSRLHEEQLRRTGVSYRVVGGLTFYERREVKDLLAYLRVAVNPIDETSMERIINVPPRRLGKMPVAGLRAQAAAEGMSLCEAVADEQIRGTQRPQARKSLAALAEVFEAVREAGKRTAREALETLIDRTGYLDYATSLGDLADYSREENIHELVSDAATYDQSEPEGGLSGWLQAVALLTAAERQEQGPAVTLTTVHAAKGLEFDHVFVTGLDEGVFPSNRALGSQDDIEEERRLMCVAITRARTGLVLTRARERTLSGMTDRQQSSMFLAEIPADTLNDTRKGMSDTFFDVGNDAEDDVVDADAWRASDEPAAVDVADPDGLRAGLRVVHPIYGRGTVVRTSGRGFQMRAMVRFVHGEERTFLVEYANLRIDHSHEQES